MSTRLFSKRLTHRAFAALLLHVVVLAFLYWLAYGIRTEFAFGSNEWLTLWVTLPGVVLIQTLVFYSSGYYHRSWHSVSFSDLAMLVQSATLSWLIIAALDYLFASSFDPPRSVLLLNWCLTILALGALRAVSCVVRVELSLRPL